MHPAFLAAQQLSRGLKPVSSALRHGLQHLTCPNCQKALPPLRQFASFTPALKASCSRVAQGKWGLVRSFQSVRQTATQAVEAKVAAVAAETTIPPYARKIVGSWLVGCSGMVFGAVILGGVTRLTESGLSMVDWKLLKDMKPPGSEAEWQAEFERYKTFPEYKYQAAQKEVTLADFKFIYYMEWGHRMWGRGVGLAFILPAIYFLKKGWVSKALKPRLAVFTGLLGFQGFLGWYMVKSGLQEQHGPNDVPRVSQYRLASHLGSAFLLYSLFLWQGLTHLTTPQALPDTKLISRLRGMSHGLMTLVFVTALSGAFVAGLDAGLVYNSWPKMADKWVPDDIGAFDPKWKNVFENPTTVQFNHRHLAESTVLVIAGFWWMCRKAPLPPRARIAVNCMAGMAFLQASLGVATLLSYVPVHLAATHQSGSLVLLSFAIWLAHELRRLPK